ncbi:MAG: proline--tRNA ligase [Chloroflexi bacterium]|nr:proline--tRNA ligase [Chloroflexota bacterium]
MRLSKLFFQTLRETPAETDIVSHQLLLRAGLIRQVAAGIFEFLPLGQRVKRKVEEIIRQEMDAIGGQEVSLPVVQPAELWQRTGRWNAIGADMARFQDRNGRDLCLGMTHEEVITDMVAPILKSYRQLPVMLYQIQTKFRDEPRPRGGLIRVREFTMKDGYSFHPDIASLDAYYPEVYQAYFNIFHRCGLEPIAVEADTGMMGGTMAHEFMALTPIGEDTLLLCEACGYRANRQIATFAKPIPPQQEALPLEQMDTPGVNTIDSLARFLDLSSTQTAKALFLVAEMQDSKDTKREQFVFAVIRGDMEMNETKLANAVKAQHMRPATLDEIRAIGAEPGYGSPLNIDRSRVLLVVDDLIPQSPNLVAGANQAGYHMLHVNYGRDYTADIVTDIAAAAEGSPCPRCGEPMHAVRGVEVGNIFKLGAKYSQAFGATYLDENSAAHPLVMGCYGIGVERLMACIVEQYHDGQGICWPTSVAPYQLSLVSLATSKTPDVAAAADDIYQQLVGLGIEVLYDDRDERAGVKFNDADLIGLPLRLTVGGKGLQRGLLELKIRRINEVQEIHLNDVVGRVQIALDGEWGIINRLLADSSKPISPV